MNQKGFTLLEGLMALGLLGIILTGVLPSFIGYMDVTTRNEERSEAIAVAQQQMEASRRADPASMPTTGFVGPDVVSVENRDYEVTTRYCVLPALCTTNSRHVLVEVSYGGRIVYETESVFTRLR